MTSRKTYGAAWEVPFQTLYRAAQKSQESAALLLEKITMEHLCTPAVVVQVGAVLLRASGLSQERRFAVSEAVVLAAAQLGHAQLCTKVLKALRAQLPAESVRLSRLVTQVAAAGIDTGDSSAQLTQMAGLIAESKDWVNQRRAIAAKRYSSASQRDMAAAVQEEVDKVQLVMDEHGHKPDPWLHLAGVYLAQQHYSKAAFCLEEVLMHDSTNVAALVAYAEVEEAVKETETARKYFSHAAMLDGKHPRALWGLLSTNAQLIGDGHVGKGALTAQQAQQLHGLTVKKLLALYEPLAAKGFAHAKVTVAVLKDMPAPAPRKHK